MKKLILLAFTFLFLNNILGQTAYIQVDGEPNLSVYLNNQFKGKTTVEFKGLIIENVNEGKNIIKIVKEGYTPYEETLTIKKGEVFAFKVKPFTKHVVQVSEHGNTAVTEKKATIETGKLIIQSVPIEIKITIPDIEGIKNSPKTKDEWLVDKLPEGEYKITFTYNQKNITKLIEIDANNTTRVFINMLNDDFKIENSLDEERKREKERLAQEKIAAERREIERQRKIEEERKRAEEQKFLMEEKMRKIDYFSFFGGLVVPLSADSKSMITYNQWQTAVNETPFTTALKKGKFGLGLGVNFGFNGIVGLEALNKTKGMRAAKLGLGIIIEASQTFQFFNFDDMRGYPNEQSWYYEGDENKPFATSSIGAGPSLSLHLGKKQTFIDLYLRADMNIFWWGKYYASTPYSFVGETVLKGYADGVKLSASPSIGVSFRFTSLYVGAECRFKLINKSTYINDFYYELDSYTTQHDVYSFTPSRGINLSYFALKLGVILGR